MISLLFMWLIRNKPSPIEIYYLPRHDWDVKWPPVMVGENRRMANGVYQMNSLLSLDESAYNQYYKD
jgi:hypothetical protein